LRRHGAVLVAPALGLALGLSGLPPGQAQARPPNDDLAEAMAIEDLPFVHTLGLRSSTFEPDELGSSCGGDSNGVWYRFTASAAREMQVAVAESDAPITVSLWRGTRHPLMEVDCRWDAKHWREPWPEAWLKEGETYYLRAAAYVGHAAETLVLRARTKPPSPPPNDRLAQALEVPGPGFHDAVSFDQATSEPGEVRPSCEPSPQPSVWYRVRPAATLALRLQSAPYGDISVWEGEAFPLRELRCGDSSLPLDIVLEANRTYAIRLAFDSRGVIDFSVGSPPPPPANDDLAAAIPIWYPPFRSVVDTSQAGSEPGELPAPCGEAAGRGVWYRLTPARARWYELDTIGSNVDTVLSVWRGDGHPLEPLLCNDNGPNLIDNSALELGPEPGQRYWIKVEGTRHSGGLLVLHVRAQLDGRSELFLPFAWWATRR
jgi:hypothetical protein